MPAARSSCRRRNGWRLRPRRHCASNNCILEPTMAGVAMTAFVLTVVASWGIYALLGMGIVLVYRTSRILNIAGGELAIFIGYIVATAIESGVPFPIAVPVGMGAAMALGLAIFWFTIRRVMGESPHVGLM